MDITFQYCEDGGPKRQTRLVDFSDEILKKKKKKGNRNTSPKGRNTTEQDIKDDTSAPNINFFPIISP